MYTDLQVCLAYVSCDSDSVTSENKKLLKNGCIQIQTLFQEIAQGRHLGKVKGNIEDEEDLGGYSFPAHYGMVR